MGATLMRTHYPLHPYTQELADTEGVLIWSEVPVYTLSTREPLQARRARARGQGGREEHRRQPEPPVGAAVVDRERALLAPGAAQTAYIKNAVRLAQVARPDAGPSALAVAGYPTARCQPAYAPLDVIGINDYFGWYPGPGGGIFDRNKLSRLPRLGAHAATRSRRSMVTEFGAEANRDGPPEEKGTYAFQQEFVNYHLGVYALQALAERRGLLGAQRVPGPPGLGRRQPAPARRRVAPEGPARATATCQRKPAWEDVRRCYTARPAGRARSARETGRRSGAGSRAGAAARGARPQVGQALVASAAAPWAGPRRAAARRRTVRSWAGPDAVVAAAAASSSSGGLNPCWDSERRNSTNSPTPSATAIRCSVPKMSISSASGDIRLECTPAAGPL